MPWLRADGFHFPTAQTGLILAALITLVGVFGLVVARKRKSFALVLFVTPLLLAGIGLSAAVNWSSPSALAHLPYSVVQALRVLAMISKVLFLCWFQLMIRWTLPRFRYDHIMRITWRNILPLSLLNILLTGILLLVL